MISRLRAPATVTAPTPRTFSSRFFTNCSAVVLSSVGVRVPSGEVSASVNTGREVGSKRCTRDSLTSARNTGRTRATFSRTSSAALRPSTSRLNWTITTDTPS